MFNTSIKNKLLSVFYNLQQLSNEKKQIINMTILNKSIILKNKGKVNQIQNDLLHESNDIRKKIIKA